MKIGFFGNTCNNNFSIIRYLKKINVDADLILYSNEGLKASNPIHNPELDTFDIAFYANNIFRIRLPHSIKPLLGLRSFTAWHEFISTIDHYDLCIGSGITPSLFRAANRKLDIFYPHATGIEWLDEPENLAKMNAFYFYKVFRRHLYNYQLNAIRSVRTCLSSQIYDRNILDSHGVSSIFGFIPTYFPEIDIPNELCQNYLTQYSLPADLYNVHKFKIFSFMRQFWVNSDGIDENSWLLISKRNDMLLYGFKCFVDSSPKINSTLFLTACGKDLSATKSLVTELNLDKHVCWMPRLPRKAITIILSSYADAAIGQLTSHPECTWGSTTWECFATGVPTIQYFSLNDESFLNSYNIRELPHVYKVSNAAQISSQLSLISTDLAKAKQKSQRNKSWFNHYNGLGAAQKFYHLLEKTYLDKSLYKQGI